MRYPIYRVKFKAKVIMNPNHLRAIKLQVSHRIIRKEYNLIDSWKNLVVPTFSPPKEETRRRNGGKTYKEAQIFALKISGYSLKTAAKSENKTKSTMICSQNSIPSSKRMIRIINLNSAILLFYNSLLQRALKMK
jgi:hypothetical protein